jgi:nucleoside-diphosphate-sugar epimerase
VGSAELVTIDRLVDIVEEIAGVRLRRRYNTSEPQGVRGRNSDNTLALELLGWEPSTPLQTGLAHTYGWIHDELARSDGTSEPLAAPAGVGSSAR